MKIDNFSFDQLSVENLKKIVPPKAMTIYDYKNDRSIPINKYLFSKEEVIEVNPEYSKRVKELEKEIMQKAEVMDKHNRELFELEYKGKYEAHYAWKEKIKENERVSGAKIIGEKFRRGFAETLFKEVDFKKLDNLSRAEMEGYEKLGVYIEKGANEKELAILKDRLNSKLLTKEEYDKEVDKLVNGYKVEVSEEYFEPLIKLFFEKIKPSALIKDFNFLDERHIFDPKNPSKKITSEIGDSMYDRAYDMSKEWVEKINRPILDAIFLDRFRTTNYTPRLLEEAAEGILGVGLLHLFKDHPSYLLHLNHDYKGMYWFGTKENREYLATGYKPHSFSDNIVKRSTKLSIRDKKIIDINSYDEIENMNLNRDEKFKLFLKILHIIDSNPYEGNMTIKEYLNEHYSPSIDFSEAYIRDILKYLKDSNELNPTSLVYPDGTLYKRRDSISNSQKEVGVSINTLKRLDANEDFYLIQGLYNHIYKKFDSNREIQAKMVLKKYWDNVVKPWYAIEESRNNFFYGVRYLVKKDYDMASSVRSKFMEDKKYELQIQFQKYLDRYSSEQRSSNHFKANIDARSFSGDIINAISKALNEEYRTPKERRINQNSVGENWINELAVTQDDIYEIANKRDISKFYEEAIERELTNVEKSYNYSASNVGDEGEKILRAMFRDIRSDLSRIDAYPKEFNPVELFVENMKVNLENKVKEHNDVNFLSRKQAPYIPTIREIVENWSPQLEKDVENPMFRFVDKNEITQTLGSNDTIDTRIPTNKIPNLGFYDLEKVSINPLNNIAYQIMLDKEADLDLENIKDISDKSREVANLEVKLNTVLLRIHNKSTEKENMVKEFDELIEKYTNAKKYAYQIEHTIDDETLVAVMQTMSRVTKNMRNKDRYIDLTNPDTLPQELEKLENRLKGVNGITRAGMLIYYTLSMNNIYIKHKSWEGDKSVKIEEMNLDAQQSVVWKNILDNQVKLEDNKLIKDLKSHHINMSRNMITEKFERYSGKHFPLFIDSETLTIYSLEWTTRYPTLHITRLPEVFTKLEIDINTSRKEKLNEINENFNILDHLKEVDEDLSREENKDYYNKHDLNVLNILDSISETMATIQTNYHLQLDQELDKALFLYIDPLMIEEAKPTSRIGLPFANIDDLQRTDEIKGIANFQERRFIIKDRINLAQDSDYENYKDKACAIDSLAGKVDGGYSLGPYANHDIGTDLWRKKVGGGRYLQYFDALTNNKIKEDVKKDISFAYDDGILFAELNDENRLNNVSSFHKLGTRTYKDLNSNKIQIDGAKLDAKFKGTTISKEEENEIVDKITRNYKTLKLFETKEELERYKRDYNNKINKNNGFK